jgi:hypothetical protein
MNTEAEIERKFWKSLRSDRVAMLGLTGVEEGHAQPMSGQILHEDDERGPIWFFTARDTDLVRAMGESHPAALHFVSKGHDLFASLQGELIASKTASSSTSCGIRMSPPGTRAARTTPNYSSSASSRSMHNCGSTSTACSRV